MASSATMRHQRHSAEASVFHSPPTVIASRPWAPLFFRVTVSIVVVWTLATIIWAIDPAFLVHTGNLFAGLLGTPAAHV